MLHEIIHLNKEYNLENDPTIEIMVPFNSDEFLRTKTKAIVIVPGGAYEFVSVRESDPVALAYMKENFITIVLKYTTKKAYPTPMHELACTMDYIRKNCDKYYIDKDKISIIGFSAGGHLVSSYGYLYKHPDFVAKTKLNPENIKPNCIVASYPVITTGEYTHPMTCQNITGGKEELYDLLSVENNIDPSYPPTFVWSTVEDTCVPYINSTLYVEALKENNVENEFFLYPFLDHGLSVISPMLYPLEVLNDKKMQEVSKWFDKSVEFIRKILD